VTTPDGLVTAAPPCLAVTDGRGTGPVEIPLERGAGLEGIILDGATREPLGGVWLNATLRGAPESGGSTSAVTRSDGRGRFAMRGLAAGACTLVVAPRPGVVIEEEFHLDRRQSRSCEVQVPRFGMLVVSVVDGKGNAVPGARVALTAVHGPSARPDGEETTEVGFEDPSRADVGHRLGQTDGTGTCVYAELPPGQFQLRVELPDHAAPTPTWARVDSDRTSEVTVQVEGVGADAAQPPHGKPDKDRAD